MRLTIIFPADTGEMVTIAFNKMPALDNVQYGIWHTEDNQVDLSTEAWDFLQAHRKDIRKLKPMMGRLEKVKRGDCSVVGSPRFYKDGVKNVFYAPIDWFKK